MPPGGHLIKHDPERKQVAARVQRLAPRLLGRHISDGAHRRTRTGQRIRPRRRVGVNFATLIAGGCAFEFRQPEIEQLGLPGLDDEDMLPA